VGVERVMRALTPAVLRFRIGQLSATNKLPDLPEKGRQDPVGSTLSVIRSVAWAAQYLGGLTLPALYIAHKDDGGILAPIASESTVVFGREILSGRSLPELAFLTGRHLAMRQPKFELVVHMKSIDELSACFLAALKLVLGSAPPAGPLSKTVSTLASVLAKQLTKEEHAELKAAITAFSNDGGQADLRRWVTGVKRSATRAGFVLCGDLPTAVALLRSSCVTDLSEEEIEEHVFDLCRFAVSGAYLKISKAMAK